MTVGSVADRQEQGQSEKQRLTRSTRNLTKRLRAGTGAELREKKKEERRRRNGEKWRDHNESEAH